MAQGLVRGHQYNPSCLCALQELQQVQPFKDCKKGVVEFQQLDLNSLKSVKQFCKSFNCSGKPLDILICNAGIMSPPQRLVSEDGLELQFQVGKPICL
jgi:NAD(P)-dependent dehydrogenase (short-subunit alcohol dehydrogenase family)